MDVSSEAVDAGSPAAALDISVGAFGDDVDRRAARPAFRKLPTWALVVLAVAVGWALGLLTSLGGSDAETSAAPVAEPDPAAASATATPVPPAATVDSDVNTAATVGASAPVIAIAQAPLRGVSIPADVQVIVNGENRVVQLELDEQISGVNQGGLGQPDRRMIVVDDHVVFMASDAVMILDPYDDAPPTRAAEGIYLLPGSDEGHVWVVGSGSNSVTNLDVTRREIIDTYDLTTVGVPLASVRSGLVVSPADRSLGTLALWSPRRGVEPLDVGAVGSFIDASGHTIALSADGELVSFDLLTGELTRTSRSVDASDRHRALISPSGDQLAIVERGSVAELPRVLVVDISSGEVLDEFESAFEWQLQWTSDHEMLFVAPAPDGVQIKVRDTEAQTETLAAELDSPNYWVTIAS